MFYGVDLADSSGGIELDTLLLAGDTGGLNLGPDPVAALERVLHDQEGYYLLGYQPEDSRDDSLLVESKAPGAIARARTRPLGSGPAERDFRLHTPNQELADAIHSPFGSGAIHALVAPLFGNGHTASELNVQVWVDVKDLTFTHQLNGLHRAGAQVLLAAFGADGVNRGQVAYTFDTGIARRRIPESAARRMGGPDGSAHSCAGSLPGEGGSARRDVEPDGHLQPPGDNPESGGRGTAAIRHRDAGERPEHAPGAEKPVCRVFPPGTSLYFGYQIYNPSSDHGKSVETETLLRLYRGDQEIFKGVPQILPAAALADPKLHVA